MPAMTADALEARTEAVRGLEGEFSDLLGQFHRMIAEQANRISAGMLPGAYKVFATIVRRESVTLSALADVLMMDKGQVSRTIRELEELGLVDRAPDPNDGRSSLLSPTAEGRARLEASRTDRANPLIDALGAWDVSDIRTLTRLMHALVTATPPDR